MQNNKKPEIMAPVGSFPALTAAIKAGANSVHFGVEQLNMRARASHNFTLKELKELAETCKKAGVTTYITLNTLLYQHDLGLMQKIMDTAKEAGIDSIIVQDVAAIQYAEQIGMPIHASTQLSISNYESVKFYAKWADTIVLAREVDLQMMEDIVKRIHEEDLRGPSGKLIRIEVFVHGALCIAQSGRCQMSLLQTNTSAQRGACLHECRKEYALAEYNAEEDKEYIATDKDTGEQLRIRGGYIMSPKDLCCLPFLDKLAAAGISVFKIEGRGRNPQYVSTVVGVYREAVDAIEEGTFTKKKVEAWMKKLNAVYNRGFSEGYYLGKRLPEWSGSAGNISTDERVFVGVVNHYFPKAKIAELNIQALEIQKGDRLVIMGKTTGVAKGQVEEMKIDDKFVEKSGKPSIVTIPFPEILRKNDSVYLLKKRALPILSNSRS